MPAAAAAKFPNSSSVAINHLKNTHTVQGRHLACRSKEELKQFVSRRLFLSLPLFAPVLGCVWDVGEVGLSMVITWRWDCCYGVPNQLHIGSSKSLLSCAEEEERDREGCQERRKSHMPTKKKKNVKKGISTQCLLVRGTSFWPRF